MMKTTRALLAVTAVLLLQGCVTQRVQSYPNHDYDTVFKSAVATLCAQDNLIVYGADKRSGLIEVQGRGLMGGPPDSRISISGADGGTPTVRVYPLPMQEYYLQAIDRSLPAGQAPAPVQQQKDSLDLERQKLELEKEKLELERQKLELEKQKQQQQQSK